MIKDIIKDNFILKQVSQEATIQDIEIANDLLDTLKHHQDHCVGLAANMIGELKSIIAFIDNDDYIVMFNPLIIKQEGLYICKERCLSHNGEKETKRYKKIKVEYFDNHFKKKIKTYTGLEAQIIQHEIDHCHGILI